MTNLDVDIDGDGKLEAAVAVRDARGNGRIELYRRGAWGHISSWPRWIPGLWVELGGGGAAAGRRRRCGLG